MTLLHPTCVAIPTARRVYGLHSGLSSPRAPEMRSSSDRKSTRLNSSHLGISYAVFCLKKKKIQNRERRIQQSQIINRSQLRTTACVAYTAVAVHAITAAITFLRAKHRILTTRASLPHI